MSFIWAADARNKLNIIFLSMAFGRAGVIQQQKKCSFEHCVAFLYTQFNRHYFFFFLGFWLGASDVVTEGVFIWAVSGLAANTYAEWGPGDPNNAGNNEDCLMLLARFQFAWVDINCYGPKNFVCERR